MSISKSNNLYVGFVDGTIAGYSAETHKKRFRPIKAHKEFLRAVEVDSRELYVITCSHDCCFKIWRVSNLIKVRNEGMEGGKRRKGKRAPNT